MESLPTIHHQHQPLCSSIHYCCPSPTESTYSSLRRSLPNASSPPSPSIRASSSPSLSHLSSESPLPNFQYPEPNKSPQIFNPLSKDSSYDAPESKSPELFNPLRQVPSLATITAASAFLFLGFCRYGFINKPITLTTLSSVVSIEESLDEKSNLEEFHGGKRRYVQSILHLKLKENIPVVHSFNKTKTDDDESWQVLKAEVCSCSERLELVRIGFEEILESDRDWNKEHEDRVLEYLEMVDKYKGMLKGVKLAMDWCERENGDVKYYHRLLSKVIDRIRVFEGNMVGALKKLKELEQE